jgi:hypothetical protein
MGNPMEHRPCVEELEPRRFLSAAVLKDIRPGELGSMRFELLPWNFALHRKGDQVFFAAAGAPGRATLWVTDGTTAGTRVVRAGLGAIAEFIEYRGKT